MKLILPKLEATLKTKEATSSTKPPLVKKPQPTVSNASQNSKGPCIKGTEPVPKALPVKPTVKTPMPKPDRRPLPPDPVVDDDMPIYQTADEDATTESEDDEEWNYEALPQYNIYNL
ncbi:uncharacterized protein LOC125240373 [Leguminivora glycinivorella]|uniref:uncharacterized protein LOC125240373 n=1 Tax=Leguminivora glycinivorella TaxID=1035111 RepID=UPI00200CFBA8|nr:uncharacterized protein LOC125240373 [Leguminivora glycinivorella]